LFPAEVLEEAGAVPQYLTGRELDGRRDFRRLPIVTIDGETARDFDDAVLVERLAARLHAAAHPHTRRTADVRPGGLYRRAHGPAGRRDRRAGRFGEPGHGQPDEAD